MFFLLVGCPARPRPLNQPQPILVEGTYTHELSGMIFPFMVDDFRRDVVQRYNQEGSDVSVGYNLVNSQSRIAATIYVYPAPKLVSVGSTSETIAAARAELTKREFETRKREVWIFHPNGRLIEDTEISIPIGGTLHSGRMATFEYDDKFGGQVQPVRSYLYIFNFVGGKWALKYRFTYPKDLGATPKIATLLQSVPVNLPED